MIYCFITANVQSTFTQVMFSVAWTSLLGGHPTLEQLRTISLITSDQLLWGILPHVIEKDDVNFEPN